MGLFSKKEVKEDLVVEYEPVIGVNEVDLALNQAKKNSVNFKGEVERNERKFPVELGEEHPFDFSQMEGLYKKFGFANGVINKFIDFVVGPGFYIKSEDEVALEIIEKFIEDVNFDIVLRAWAKEALTKGNGFLEIGGKKGEIPKGVKVLNANHMYVKRDSKGKVMKYNQYTRGLKRFDKNKVLPFDVWQIAHMPFDKIGDDAYGGGVLAPGLANINGLLQNDGDLHMLMSRKANSPYDITMGKVVGGKYYKPSKNSIDDMGKKLEYLRNKHEWVHDGLTDIKALDFGNIGEKFNEILNYDIQMLFYTFQVPSVLMGTAGVAEGLAKIQMDAFERRIKSIQMEFEKVIEKDLFNRILEASSIFGVHVEFEWGQPSNTEKADRIERLKNLLTSPMVSETLRGMLEKDIVKLLDYDVEDYEKMKEEEDIERKKLEDEERKREENRPQPIVPGSNAKRPIPVKKKKEVLVEIIRNVGVKWGIFSHKTGKRLGTYKTRADAEKALKRMRGFANNSYELEECGCPHYEDISEEKYDTINEWLGFNYKEYKEEIRIAIDIYGFSELAAKNVVEEMAGMFSVGQVKELKKVLSKGFANGESIREIKNSIRRNVKPKDLLKMEDGKIVKKDGVGVVVKSAKNRDLLIARTEVTRMANEGALRHYKKGGIKRVKFVASFGARTCPICEDLDGGVYKIGEGPVIPVHPMCRCTWVPVTELS